MPQVKRWFSLLVLPLIVCSLLACGPDNPPAVSIPGNQPKDRFEGELSFDWVGQGIMKLRSEFSYVDENEKRWTCPAGYQTDGASIPQSCWSLVGSPYSGNYVKAAVVHDIYCEEYHRTERWEDVHEMFYKACLRDGVEPRQAKILYTAVYYFGPRWPDPTGATDGSTNGSPDGSTVQPSVAAAPDPLAEETVEPEVAAALAEAPVIAAEVRTPRPVEDFAGELTYSPEVKSLVRRRGRSKNFFYQSEGQPADPRETQALVDKQKEILERAAQWIENEDPNIDHIKRWDLESTNMNLPPEARGTQRFDRQNFQQNQQPGNGR